MSSATSIGVDSHSTPGGPLGRLLSEVNTYAELMGEAALAGTSLTLPSSQVLQIVLDEPGITISAISRRVSKTQQAVSQVAARLGKLGFVERQLGPGRGVGLFLTETGLEMAEEAIACERELDSRVQELLGEERSEAFRQMLIESRAILRGAH